MNSHNSDNLVQRVRRLFGKGVVCRLQVAALPWRKAGETVEIMLITSRDTGRWVLPKGWPETGELLHAAAAREAGEEAGISGAIAHSETGRYFYAKGKSSGKDLACEVLVYALEVDRVAEKWKERRERKRRWMPAAEAARLVAEPDLAALIAEFAGNPRLYA